MWGSQGVHAIAIFKADYERNFALSKKRLYKIGQMVWLKTTTKT